MTPKFMHNPSPNVYIHTDPDSYLTFSHFVVLIDQQHMLKSETNNRTTQKSLIASTKQARTIAMADAKAAASTKTTGNMLEFYELCSTFAA